MSSDRHYTQERVEVAKAYPGKKWSQKVLGMSDSQIHAVYVSIKKRREKAEKRYRVSSL